MIFCVISGGSFWNLFHCHAKNLTVPLNHPQYKDSTGRIPDFKIEPEIALELLIASKYLDC
jgi:hypothetical protein